MNNSNTDRTMYNQMSCYCICDRGVRYIRNRCTVLVLWWWKTNVFISLLAHPNSDSNCIFNWKKSFASTMDVFKNDPVFFANSSDLTEYFRSHYCRNVGQGVSIRNFIKNYPDAVYTTARLSGKEYMVYL